MTDEVQARLEESRRKVRERVKKHRDKKKQEKQAEIATSNAETAHDFWAAQRQRLSTEEVERLMGRHNAILELAAVMREYVNGTDGTTAQDLADTIAEVKEEVEKNGVATMEVTLIEKFWLDKSFFDAVVAGGGATATLIQYGLLTALPDHSYHTFQSKTEAVVNAPYPTEEAGTESQS
jgi:hypothetical protein